MKLDGKHVLTNDNTMTQRRRNVVVSRSRRQKII